ncbi:hypothetical protein NGTWS0302_34590 [Mycolicibacterium cyprinidarum]|uniref:Integral membrane protein n=1 Tax=Mycolicibacterium cyprinidarum TaxID=2860311 RepID=A0ABQ4VCU8_9MYCO|nr:hypothetical protein NGTWS1803_18870 [Mycolicibacterium sp. NGTWS1803]GJF13738.1 hypothetical protein NGTWS0302_34590 [Mycolicibacterium sp. NGTWS0302]GJF18381.1 hypothetical protein NGTWS1702_26270 [Mycolicibacterium sp. NGTWSNA01]
MTPVSDKQVLRKLLLPSAFGVLMVGAAVHRAGPSALVVAAAALVAVSVGGWWRPAATVAVLLAVTTVLFGDPAPMYTALAGLAGTAYLVLRHGAGRAAAPTMFAAVGFATMVTIAVAAPVQLPWLPLAAPLVLLAGYLLSLRPFLTRSPL